MATLPAALRAIFAANTTLQFGLSHRLFNLTALAAHLTPQLAATCQKPFTTAAVQMALSRLQRQLLRQLPAPQHFRLQDLTVQNGLALVSYPRTPEIHTGCMRLYLTARTRQQYCLLTESTREITLAVAEALLGSLPAAVKARPLQNVRAVAAVTARFAAAYSHAPGLFATLLQQFQLAGLNVLELSSTFTELTFFVAAADAPRAFALLHTRFGG